MAIRLGDEAPDFTAETTEGQIAFHKWLGNSWGVFFSHPRDFTPVCTTELGRVAKLKSEFDKRNCKVIGLSVDPLSDHKGWAKDIQETQGAALNFPLIADPDRKIVLKALDSVSDDAQKVLSDLASRRCTILFAYLVHESLSDSESAYFSSAQ